jgi:hypothetical protein
LKLITAKKADSKGFPMPTYIRIAEPKVLPQQPLVLGVPLIIWALSLLLIAGSAHYNIPIASFDPQEQLAPF